MTRAVSQSGAATSGGARSRIPHEWLAGRPSNQSRGNLHRSQHQRERRIGGCDALSALGHPGFGARSEDYESPPNQSRTAQPLARAVGLQAHRGQPSSPKLSSGGTERRLFPPQALHAADHGSPALHPTRFHRKGSRTERARLGDGPKDFGEFSLSLIGLVRRSTADPLTVTKLKGGAAGAGSMGC